MEKNITFDSLMDGNLHPLYFVNGSTSKMYMVKAEIGDNPTSKMIRLRLYDKNGKKQKLTIIVSRIC